METKSFWQSKTFLLAVIQALVGIVVVFDTTYPGVGWLVMAKSVLDIALRFFTDTKIVTSQM